LTPIAEVSTGPSRQQQLETLGTFLWLLMDFLWLVEWSLAGTVAGVIGFLCLTGVLWLLPRDLATQAAASSASCWLLMNLFWMLGESYTQPGLILTAQLVGAVAVGLLGVSVWSGGIGGPVMQQFRRIKVG